MGKRMDGAGKVLVGGGIIAAVLLFLSKGSGPGLGLTGGNSGYYGGGGPKPPVKIHFTKDGIFVDGREHTPDAAAAKAYEVKAAILSTTGDATFGDVEAMEKKLLAAGVAVSKAF